MCRLSYRGTTTVSFSNGDAPLRLDPLGDGTWQQTWQSASGIRSDVELTVSATSPSGITGSRQVDVALADLKNPPITAENAVGSTANFVAYSAIAPGGSITIYGSNLGDGTYQNQSVPLANSLGTTQVLIGGLPAPLFMSAPARLTPRCRSN